MLPRRNAPRIVLVLVVAVAISGVAIGGALVLLPSYSSSTTSVTSFSSSASNPTTSSSSSSSATSYPVEVVTVTGPVPPYVHGEPVVSMLLVNVGGAPIASLNATLEWVPPPGVQGANPTYPFIFNVSSSNPLLPGQSTALKLTLFGPDFASNQDYPLTISGTFKDGAQFSYTESILFVRESL